MFLRRHRRTIDDISYDYWSLCESVRTAAGPRQRVVATLGKLADEEARPEASWDEMRHLLEGRPAAEHLRLDQKQVATADASSTSPLPPPTPHAPRWELADVADHIVPGILFSCFSRHLVSGLSRLDRIIKYFA